MLEGGPTSNGVHAMLPMEEQVTSPSPHIVLNGEHQSYLRGLRPKMRQSLRCYSSRGPSKVVASEHFGHQMKRSVASTP